MVEAGRTAGLVERHRCSDEALAEMCGLSGMV